MRIKGDHELSGPEFDAFLGALLRAYPDEAALEWMLRVTLGHRLAEITPTGSDLRTVAFALIEIAEAEGWSAELLTSALAKRPKNPELLRFAQRFKPEALVASSDALEAVIGRSEFVDAYPFYERLGELMSQVCRVEFAGANVGTGLLVGPDVVITNHHVMKQVLGPSVPGQGVRPDAVVLRFDYLRLKDGGEPSPGVEHRLASREWLIDSSEHSPLDLLPLAERDGEPSADQLDYALLRLDGEPGREPQGPSGSPTSPARGWMEVAAEPPAPAPGGAMVILQHPGFAPLQIATGTIGSVNANGTRVRYTTDTQPGSSGSPCFDGNLRLVALHHSKVPSDVPENNEGIPFGAILALLRQRGLGGVLAAPGG